jgi:glycosyltransferase involved in cell wall biosynthesis
MPKVSVLMPVWNGARYLREAIKSIQNQTFSDWEFIIVSEAGSTDMTAVLLAKLAQTDDRIHVIQNVERLGIAESLNVGIRAATGEYIARVDVDDPSYPERFRKQVEFLDAHPEIFLCSTWRYSVTPRSRELQRLTADPAELRAALFFGNDINHSTVMLRRERLLKEGWFYNSSSLAEDYELWSRIMGEVKFANLEEALVDHRWGYGNISMLKGDSIRWEARETAARSLKQYLGIEIPPDDLVLLADWRSAPKALGEKDPAYLLRGTMALWEEMEAVNDRVGFFEKQALRKILSRRWDWVSDACGISFTPYLGFAKTTPKPRVTVLIPVYNGARHLREAVDSIIAQDYASWELLLVVDPSADGSEEVAKAYGKTDNRVRYVINDTRLGLSGSLNLGITLAQGDYIARLDADDLAHPTRLSKQVNYLDAHRQVGVVGSWQHHFGTEDWIHKPATDPKQCRADLIFYCHICHSTLMLRRSVFLENQLYYDGTFLAEDFELWTRVLGYVDIANIPEVLGEYRHGENNVTRAKADALGMEHGRIVALALQRYWGIALRGEDHRLLSVWNNPYNEASVREKEQMLARLQEILVQIDQANHVRQFCDRQALLNAMTQKWRYAKYGADWREVATARSLAEAFQEKYHIPLGLRWRRFCENNPTLPAKVKKVIKKTLKVLFNPLIRQTRGFIDKYMDDAKAFASERFEQLYWRFDGKVWSLEKKVNALQLQINQATFADSAMPLQQNESIRAVFLFQVAAFWPSLAELYRTMVEDENFTVTVICYDEEIDNSIKVDSAESFLQENHIPYQRYEDVDMLDLAPHIVFLQTPYDGNRSTTYKSQYFRQNGIRVIYLSYGIEFPNSEQARLDHFARDMYQNLWRQYTFSPAMLPLYRCYSLNSKAVRALGVPRFDALYHALNCSLLPEVSKRAGGRKLMLWKVHFPKVVMEEGNLVMVTPELGEYVRFAHSLTNYPDIFFIFMPHPRFTEFDIRFSQVTNELLRILSGLENVCIDRADDYKPSLLNADYIIVDRSAVMVEAGVKGLPVLYMTNADYTEPLTPALKPLIDSYYQGTTCEDMLAFVEMCLAGEDPGREARLATWRECIPFFDGQSSRRIADDIYESLLRENEQKNVVKYDESC